MINKRALFRKNRWDHLVLRGKKVIIRSLRRDDIDKRLSWKEYPDPLYFHYNPPHLSLKEREGWFLKRKHDPNMVYFAIDNRQGQLVGFVCLYKTDKAAKSAWVGIYLGYEFTDKGYGTDAISVLAKYFFEEIKFEKMFLDVASHNKRAIRCYSKCGFRFLRTIYNKHDPRAKLDIFGDDRFKNIRIYFKKEENEVLAQFDEMVLTKDMWFAQGSSVGG